MGRKRALVPTALIFPPKQRWHERNHTYEGFNRKHFDAPERDELPRLIKRASVAITRVLRSLKSCKTAPPGRPREPRGTVTPERREPGEPGTEPAEP